MPKPLKILCSFSRLDTGDESVADSFVSLLAERLLEVEQNSKLLVLIAQG